MTRLTPLPARLPILRWNLVLPRAAGPPLMPQRSITPWKPRFILQKSQENRRVTGKKSPRVGGSHLKL